MSHSELLQTLRAIVGDAHVLTQGDLTGYELDWRKRERGKSRHGAGGSRCTSCRIAKQRRVRRCGAY